MLPDALIARLAERQGGCVTHAQLLGLGLSRAAIHHRVRHGRLTRLHRGVYAVGGAVLDSLGHAQAAWLAVGGPALISHGAAAVVWRMLPEHVGAIDVTRPTGSARATPGIRIHVCKIAAEDRALRHGLRLTSPARTLLDLAETEPETTVARALGEAEVRRLVTQPLIAAAFPGWHGRRGLATLRGLIGDGSATGGTRSPLEDLLLPLVRRAGLPLPVLNAYLHGMEVDAVWHRERVVVELDGRRYHDTDTAYESDRARDSHLAAHGYLALRFTYRRLRRDSLAVIAELAAVLARRELASA